MGYFALKAFFVKVPDWVGNSVRQKRPSQHSDDALQQHASRGDVKRLAASWAVGAQVARRYSPLRNSL